MEECINKKCIFYDCDMIANCGCGMSPTNDEPRFYNGCPDKITNESSGSSASSYSKSPEFIEFKGEIMGKRLIDVEQYYPKIGTTEREKAIQLKNKFGELADAVIDEMLDNTNECRGRYRRNHDRVCIREYWLGVRNELNTIMK